MLAFCNHFQYLARKSLKIILHQESWPILKSPKTTLYFFLSCTFASGILSFVLFLPHVLPPPDWPIRYGCVYVFARLDWFLKGGKIGSRHKKIGNGFWKLLKMLFTISSRDFCISHCMRWPFILYLVGSIAFFSLKRSYAFRMKMASNEKKMYVRRSRHCTNYFIIQIVLNKKLKIHRSH